MFLYHMVNTYVVEVVFYDRGCTTFSITFVTKDLNHASSHLFKKAWYEPVGRESAAHPAFSIIPSPGSVKAT
jgi:hypothetical protein